LYKDKAYKLGGGNMAGKIKFMIDKIVQENAKGDKTIESTTKTKLILRGINPNSYSESSIDDPVILDKLEKFAKELNLKI
jgi:hypothetical protein